MLPSKVTCRHFLTFQLLSVYTVNVSLSKQIELRDQTGERIKNGFWKVRGILTIVLS